MRKIIVLFSLILMSSLSFGQNKPKSMKELRDSIFTVMKLSDVNKQKIHDMIAESSKGQKTIKEDPTITEEQKKEKLNALRQEIAVKEKAILTAEQSQVWRDFATTMRNKTKK